MSARFLAQRCVAKTENKILPFGMGRSYGDSCLNDGGTLLHTSALNHWIDFDKTTGLLRCEAGVSLADILAICVPHGWFLPATPGTKFVTLGGAVANDVHGKIMWWTAHLADTSLRLNCCAVMASACCVRRQKIRVYFAQRSAVWV